MTSYKRPYRHTFTIAPLLLGGLAAPLHAQTTQSLPRFGADQLQTLSIGARAIGMGSAYSIIANDSSATFWNPACLDNIGVLGTHKHQFDFEFRTVSQATKNIINGDPNKENGFLALSSSSTQPPLLSYVGFAIPIQFRIRPKAEKGKETVSENVYAGTLGFSYALGGYANLDSISDDVTFSPDPMHPTGPANALRTDTFSNTSSIIRNSIFTAAYGKGLRAKTVQIQYGLGIYFVSQDQLLSQTQTIQNTIGGNVTPVQNSSVASSDHASGTGVILGMTFRPYFHREKDSSNLTAGRWTYGFSYRTGPSLSGFKANSTLKTFDSELPDRLSVGTAYQGSLWNHDITVATEFQHLSSANSAHQLDQRRSVTNFNFGIEYTPLAQGGSYPYRMPVRLGFHTIANANTGLFSYDDAVTFGLSLQSVNKDQNIVASFETGLEYLTISHKLQYTLSARFRF